MAYHFQQDTVLVVAENDRTAYLVPVVDIRVSDSVTWEHLGAFESVGTERPDSDAFTKVEGTYWVVRPTAGKDLEGGI